MSGALPIIGSIAGGLLSRGGGGSTTVQKADPWSGLQPYLKQLYSSAGDWFGSQLPQYYPGQTLAGQAPESEAALAGGTMRALGGSPNLRAAQAQNLATIGGQYLGSNPYLSDVYSSMTTPLVNQYRNAVAPGLASQFSGAGRFGSGAHQQAIQSAQEPLAQGLATAASQLYGGSYENERARQQAATMAGPGFAGADYFDIDKLMNIGQARQQTAQDLINANIARFEFGQNQPLAKLQALNALLQGGSPYATQTQQQRSSQQNPFANAMGGAMAGYRLGDFAQGLFGAPNQTGGLAASGYLPDILRGGG